MVWATGTKKALLFNPLLCSKSQSKQYLTSNGQWIRNREKRIGNSIHFVCLTQKALINSNIPSNTVTKLRLKELEDVLIGFYSEYNLQEDKRLTDYSATTTETDTLFNSSRHSLTHKEKYKEGILDTWNIKHVTSGNKRRQSKSLKNKENMVLRQWRYHKIIWFHHLSWSYKLRINQYLGNCPPTTPLTQH